MSDSIEDGCAPHVAKPGEHFFLREHQLKQLEVFVENLARLVKDNQQESRRSNQRISFHLTQVFDDSGAPLWSISHMSRTALPELVCHFHFKPQRVGGAGLVGWI